MAEEEKPEEKISKNARKRARRDLSNKLLPDADPNSKDNNDVGAIPDVKVNSNPNENKENKKKRDKKSSKFFGKEPTEIDIAVARKGIQAFQKYGMGMPEAVQIGNVIIPIALHEMKVSTFVMDEKGEIKKEEKNVCWEVGRAVGVMSENIISKGLDFMEEHPNVAATISLGHVGWCLAREGDKIQEAIKKASEEVVRQNSKVNKEAEEVEYKKNEKVENIAGVPIAPVE